MSTPLTNIKGIGPSTAEDLQAHGIESTEDLANASVSEISAVPGFGAVRAQQIKEAAAALLRKAKTPSAMAPDQPVPGGEPVAKEPKKSKKKEAVTKGKKEKKSKDNDKKSKKGKKQKKQKKK
jgi:predicted RecB family nuclease